MKLIRMKSHILILRPLVLKSVKRLIKTTLWARKRLAEAGGKQIVTLDMDSTAVRLLEVKGRRITKWGSLSFRQGDDEGALPDPQQISDHVRVLMNSCHIKAKKAMVSISGIYSVNRMVALAFSPGKSSIQEKVLEAMKETLSLNMNELYTSWGTTGINGGMRNVLAVGVPRDIVDAQLQALKGAGVRPRSLELKALALVRAVQKAKALILNIEASSFDIIIVTGSIPAIMRTLAWQRDDLSVAERAAHLAATLDLTVDFYNSRHPDDAVAASTPIFVTGQLSGDPDLIEQLQSRLTYAAEPLTVPFEYPASLPVQQYAVNIGLALRGVPVRSAGQNGNAPLNIDLLPEAYRSWRPTIKQMGYALALVSCIAIAALLYQSSAEITARTADLDARYTILNTELQRRQLELKNRVPLQKALDEYRAILAKSDNFTGDLEVIYSKAEEAGVELKSVEYESKNIIVVADSNGDYRRFREYAAALESTGNFSDFVLPPEGVPFTTSGPIQFQPQTTSQAVPAK